jgi:ABC-type methionine transport system ATPase subunit
VEETCLDGTKLRADRITVARRSRRKGELIESVVLEDVSLSVRPGEVFGVVGPSGSGKTTLLRALNGLEDVTRGRVVLDGVDASSIEATALRRRVGMVFQTPALFDGTVRENVSYGLRLAHEPADAVEDRVRECLRFVGLGESFIDRDARELSQGEQQRVSFARTLAPAPEVFLMDEPTSALDPSATARILELVRALRDEMGLTVIFVTHLLEQARAVCDRALLLVDGRGVEEGAVPQLFDAPGTDLMRRFVAGRLESGEEERR